MEVNKNLYRRTLLTKTYSCRQKISHDLHIWNKKVEMHGTTSCGSDNDIEEWIHFQNQDKCSPNVNGTIERTLFRSKTIKQALKQYKLANTIPMKKESCNIDLLVRNGYHLDIVSA